MSLAAAEMLWMLVGAYLGVGAGVAFWLLLGGVRRIDPLAAEAPFHVRALFAPGMAALWPVMVGIALSRALSRAPSRSQAEKEHGP